MDIAIGILAGLLAGTISGMLGVGGGTVTIPAMVLLLSVEQHTAQGVALAAMIVTATAGAVVQHRQGNIDWRVAAWIAPVAVVFSLLGAWAAGVVAAEWLTRMFAVVLLIIGCRMLLLSRGGGSVSTS
jgi:uncharacterized membrane protein YfcA